MPLSEFIFVLVVLLGIAMLVTGLCRKLPIPFTVVLVVIGVFLSHMADSVTLLHPLKEFELNPEVMLFVFLPALIFESGFALDARQMTKDLPAILVLAIPAMLMSTVIVGFGVWFMLDTRLIVALVFGALISATDPVAVISLFKELGAPNRLMVLVEGESLLNDATAIVAFSILVALAVSGSGIVLSDVDNVIVEFLRVFVGGVILGAVIGFGACELLYRIHANTSVILTTSIVVAYASFVGGEHLLHVSGVMAVVGAAISLRLFGMSRIRQDATHSIHETWEVIALCCNSLLFLMVGLSVNTENLLSRIGPVAIVIALVMAARALSIYTLVPLTVRLFKLPKVSIEERHIMWWGGLKGGLAIAVVLSIPSSLPEREFLFDLTIGMVMFTLLFCAPTINPLMSRLGMNTISRGETLELRSALIGAKGKFTDNANKLIRSGLVPDTDIKRFQNQIENSLEVSWYLHHDAMYEDRELIAMLRVYHVENYELKNLYETGFIK
jgi:CPA1 family monovalent cation:H+ antiporter